MTLSAPPYRQPVTDRDGMVTRAWEEWFGELQRVIGAMPHLQTFAGTPNGKVTGYPGDLVGNTSGGANVSLYVKESGLGTTAGWVAK